MEEGILVSPRMMADHMPDYLTAVLRRMAHARASRDAHDSAADKSDRGTSPVRVSSAPTSSDNAMLVAALVLVLGEGHRMCSHAFTDMFST